MTVTMEQKQDNSIYEYYKQISSRFYLAREKGRKRIHLWEPMAKPIQVPGFREFDFFYLQMGTKHYLCEGLSGSVIIAKDELATRKQRRMTGKHFKEKLPELLKQMGGRAAINQAIVNFIFDNDQTISPRYKALPQ